MTISDDNGSARTTASYQQGLAALRNRVRSAAQFPGVEVQEAHGHLGFTVRGRRFAWFLVDHHDDGRLALVLKAPPGDQDALVSSGRGYFIPSYLGSRGWIGIDLAHSARPDWDEIPDLIEQAWRMNASKTAIAQFDETRRPGDGSR